MHQVFFYIGPFPVRAYSLMVDLGMLSGLVLAWYLSKRKGKYTENILDMAFFVLLASLLGARLWEVVFDWGYYSTHLTEIPALWLGGLSVQGGIFGGLAAVIIYCRVRRISFWEYADQLAPGLLLGQAIGRVGCYLNGCCYGVPTGSSLGVVYPQGTDAFHFFGSTPLLPTVLFEAGWDLAVMFLLIWLLWRKPFDGFVTLLYFILYSVGRFALEFYRADSLVAWGLKTAQATSLATLLAAIVLMIILWKKNQPGGINRAEKC